MVARLVLVQKIGVRVPARQPTNEGEEVLSTPVRMCQSRESLQATRDHYINKFMYFVYLIECNDKSIYTGITTDVARRFKEHKNGEGGHYTSSKKVIKILYTEQCKTRSEALKREAEIKGWKREKKLALIKTNE